LADAHRLAMEYLDAGGESRTLNCGYGRGFSVREVLDTVEQVTGKPLNISYAERRAGDPPELIADASQLTALFGWQPRYNALDTIVRTGYAWECKLAAGQVVDGRARG
jgi:UDP-glucose 4-epimerase